MPTHLTRGRCLAPALGVLSLALSATLLTAPAGATPGPHSSDGRRGALLPAGPGVTQRVVPQPPAGWEVAPGVAYRAWSAQLPQGAVRMHLLSVDLATPGVSVDLAHGRAVTSRAPLTTLLSRQRAAVGVNADFFDITGTGAPLGVGRSRDGGLRHGPRSGWNTCFRIDSDGRARIGTVSVVGAVRQAGRRVVALAGLNSPALRRHQVGVYTDAWGPRPGRRVLGGDRRVHQVRVVDGVVRSSTSRPRRGGAVSGQLLLGRGRGAEALARLRVGQPVRISVGSSVPRARVVTCGSVRLLRGGAVAAPYDRQLHPRTAVAVDHGARRLLLLVADGRSRHSAGLTLRQLARQLRTLGADDALNLDGGGSSTMVAPDADGVAGVRNRPSDGRQRGVPNGLLVHYPAG